MPLNTGQEFVSNRQVLGFVFKQYGRRPIRFAFMLVLLLIAAAIDLSIPFAAAHLIGVVSVGGKRVVVKPQVWRAWAMLSTAYLAFYFLRQVAFRLMNRFSAFNMEDLVSDAFARVQLFSLDWYADTFPGATVRSISRGMWAYRNVSDMLLIMLGPAIIVLVGLSISMILRAPIAGIAELTLICIYIVVNIIITSYWLRPANLLSTALDSRIDGALADVFNNMTAVKTFGAEDAERERLAIMTAAWRTATVKTWNRSTDLGAAVNVLLVTLQVAPSGIVVKAWVEGRASPGDVAFTVSSFMLMASYLRTFSEVVRGFQKGLDDLEYVAAVERARPDVTDPPEATVFRPRSGEIEFDNVSFRYKGLPRPLFSEISVSIRAGERVAVVGQSGAGKSTFIKLLQRFHDIESGEIRIDGQNIALVTQRSLRGAIATVPQDPALFHRTLAENIAYPRRNAPLAEIIWAAKHAIAHEFIMALPNGYDTIVGERGMKLSGGERQRIAIARAFLANAPILLLDEATSSLDIVTEGAVQESLNALMVGRTTIIIAHRLSTIQSADRILVFSDGRIIEDRYNQEYGLQNGLGAFSGLGSR